MLMTHENYIKARLVTLAVDTAYHMGSVDAMLAVAQVIANRVKAGWCGGDWLQIIENAGDVAGNEIHHQVIDPHNGSFRELLRRVDDIYYGTAEDDNVNTPTGEVSLYYVEMGRPASEWFDRTILKDYAAHPRIAKVGLLNFHA
jgi:hypothetical protein